MTNKKKKGDNLKRGTKRIISLIGILFLIILFFLLIESNQKLNNISYAASSNTSDIQLMARAINGEARGEPYEGQVAVGAVILN